MATIMKAHAYCNNEVGYLVWKADGKIPGCLGFRIERVILNADNSVRSRHILPSWVAFEGQTNEKWEPQDTSVWPVQKFAWRDLTLRRLRDELVIRDPEFQCYYEITPVGEDAPPGRTRVVPTPGLPAYSGVARPLYICGPTVKTNIIRVTGKFDSIEVAFNNGILSTQNLRRQLGTVGDKPPSKTQLIAELRDPQSDVRAFLAGDILPLIKSVIDRAVADNLKIFASLYELSDPELIDLLKANAARLHLVLSTAGKTAKEGQPIVWDTTNADARRDLKALLGNRMQHRMFNNSAHIGHNKFIILTTQAEEPIAVFTGSTNWTPTGLAGQTNNALFIDDTNVARAYFEYWKRLHNDALAVPNPIGAPNNTVQGQALRTANRTSPVEVILDGGTTHSKYWYSPNTAAVSKRKDMPVDMADVFAAMENAKKAIFLLCFNPGSPSVIQKAMQVLDAKPDLLISGAISEPTALPGYVKPASKQEVVLPGGQRMTIPTPAIYTPVVNGKRLDRVMMIRAAALRGRVGDFRGELLTTGNAIIHNKTVVIDPLSPDCVVCTGSHNLGYKASYANDENLLIFRRNTALAIAYMIHSLDIFEHYRFRAIQEERWIKALSTTGRPPEGDDKRGYLQTTDGWQQPYVDGRKGQDLNYLLNPPSA